VDGIPWFGSELYSLQCFDRARWVTKSASDTYTKASLLVKEENLKGKRLTKFSRKMAFKMDVNNTKLS